MLFGSVEVVRTANANSPSAEILMLPKLEMREHVLSMALVLRRNHNRVPSCG
jgi:hypothetical protein